MKNWAPPDDWLKITTIDVHTEGEPFRVITGGFPDLLGETILARRRYVKAHLDYLRTALMWEPRGHADMYGCIVTPPVSPEADIGVLFMHNEGYSTMCGHGIIGIATVALETGMLPMIAPETIIKIDTPAGLVTAHARVSGGRVQSVYFHNVPSFVLALDETVEVPGLGKLRYDLAFGGAFYAYVQAEEVGLTCAPEDFRALIEKGMAIKRAVMASRLIIHPFEEDLSFLYGTIFIGPPLVKGAHSRNVCVFADGQVDRCPTGTGISGRLVIHYARGEIDLNDPIVIESIIGSRFTGSVVETTTFGPHPAIIPKVEGTAHITGRHQFLIDPTDPLRNGFILR
ncbi:MAG: proline racemase family protein [Candidatus Bathyarchaeota archaeon]|nr:proline racemase family protein [Candidatus Bathyarchaeota archaeon]